MKEISCLVLGWGLGSIGPLIVDSIKSYRRKERDAPKKDAGRPSGAPKLFDLFRMKAQLFEQPCALALLLLILPLYHSDNLKMMLLAHYLGASLGSGARRQIFRRTAAYITGSFPTVYIFVRSMFATLCRRYVAVTSW